MSISSIICRGYGVFGCVGKLPTLGYSSRVAETGTSTTFRAMEVHTNGFRELRIADSAFKVLELHANGFTELDVLP